MSVKQEAIGIAPTARERLKRATDSTHARLDARLSEHDLGSADGYARFLLIHAAPLIALEDAISRSAVVDRCPGWLDGRRADALVADLDGLGHDIPLAPHALALDDAAAWGAAYVLEGSRLGAKVLARRAVAAGDPAVAANLRFLSHRGGPSWRDFLPTLEAALDRDGTVERAVGGARAAFEAFEASVDADDRGEAFMVLPGRLVAAQPFAATNPSGE